MEFHISRSLREKLDLDDLLFGYTGNVIFANVAASRRLVKRLNEIREREGETKPLNAGALFAMGLIDELSHAMVARYRKEIDPAVLSDGLRWLGEKISPAALERLLLAFTEQFPNMAVYRGEQTAAQWLKGTTDGLPNREAALEELLLLWLANANSAFSSFRDLFEDSGLKQQTAYVNATKGLPRYFETRPPLAPELGSLLDALQAPMLASPGSLTGQLDYIREHWVKYLGEDVKRVLLAVDVVREEDLAIWTRFHPPGLGHGGHAEPHWQPHGFVGDEYVGFDEDFVVGADGIRRPRMYAADHQAPLQEYEAFSPDQAWMPNVVLMAKSTYVWLEQLSRKYGWHIHRLDHIPDEELQLLAQRGMTALWLIGLWERSTASQTIKRLRGQTDAVASAYSLKEYRIAEDLGGTEAYERLRNRAAAFGLRLASDMVPNHMGIDSAWVIEHPDWFISRPDSPFPVYSFEGPDLSTDSRVEIKIEDHYYDQTDAAVAFRLRHHHDGTTRYVYHGNDGTTFAWNDTAQLDYSKQYVREQVIQTILHVAQHFPIIRFDAAMTLAKRHVQRLWFPLPGVGGSIPSRAEYAISQEQFDALMPHEFWREVVDRVAAEVPGTLLLAEAFWLLEGYFVRTLGMHRVYNSAFMNMLRDEENAKYRSYLKKTIEFDPDILKRYVNFMSNPDERTAVDQFGTGDKFFGTSMLLATLPGLPMFAHGQIEGLTERYGMDFKHPRLNESADHHLADRHQREIAPLLKNRSLFAESSNFVLYDFWTDHGTVDENVFAYSNRLGDRRALLLYNNSYGSTHGTIHVSAAFMDKGTGSLVQRSLSHGLALPSDPSIFISYRDTVRHLEYLHRTTELERRGLSFGLKGYGYLALQDWRERHASAEQPWDQLCDVLHGAGVYNLDEALSMLRMRPVHEALRNVINFESIHAFAEQAGKLAEVSDGEGVAMSTAEVTTPSAHPHAEEREPVDTPSSKPAVSDGYSSRSDADKDLAIPKPAAPRAASADQIPIEQIPPSRFQQHCRAFLERVIEVLPGFPEELSPAPADSSNVPADGADTVDAVDGTTQTPEAIYAKASGRLADAVLMLASSGTLSSADWPKSARRVLPGIDGDLPPAETWAPVLAWIALRSLPGGEEKRPVFDQLQLRAALAEIFASLGIEGESSWRAAARVRVLLAPPQEISPAAMLSRGFWDDPDIHWLAGVNQAYGTAYLQEDGFEELVSWLQLPSLVSAITEVEDASQLIAGIQTSVRRTCQAAAAAHYELDKSLANLAEEAPRSEETSKDILPATDREEIEEVDELDSSEADLEPRSIEP